MNLVGSTLLTLFSFANLCFANEQPATAKPVKVAFIGDSGYKGHFKKVLKLIKEENVDLVLHSGDLAYHEGDSDSPKNWNQRINDVLGETFPYLFLIGNHDVPHWFQENDVNYASLLKKRIADNPEIVCHGEPGIKSYCTFRGILFILSGVGSYGEGHEEYLEQTLSTPTRTPFRICAWHKNQEDMQTGFKPDEVGWQAYQICQKHGAMIMTGHEHTYARTKNLNKLGNRAENYGAHGNPEIMELKPGNTFVVVSGLGGNELYPFNCKHNHDTWWASLYSDKFQMRNGVLKFDTCKEPHTAMNNEHFEFTYGALFITFNVNGNPNLAKAEFKTIQGDIVDNFDILVQDYPSK